MLYLFLSWLCFNWNQQSYLWVDMATVKLQGYPEITWHRMDITGDLPALWHVVNISIPLKAYVRPTMLYFISIFQLDDFCQPVACERVPVIGWLACYWHSGSIGSPSNDHLWLLLLAHCNWLVTVLADGTWHEVTFTFSKLQTFWNVLICKYRISNVMHLYISH